MNSLKGRIAIVTGSSRGIGKAIAIRFAAEGASVIINFMAGAKEAEAVVEEIARRGGSAAAVQADASTPGGVAALFDAAEMNFGPANVLVNNAGISLHKLIPISEVSDEQFDRVFSVNCRGVFVSLREASRRMPDGGRIVNISSTLTAMPLAGYSVYAGSKAAVEMFTRILAKELEGRNITVNAISPGPVDTELFNRGKTEEVKRRLADMAPLKRLGTPSDIASVAAFLAGDDGGWINGQVVRANGGMT
jgi:3-oxoacyl-[acyl-carrier protein] reductase